MTVARATPAARQVAAHTARRLAWALAAAVPLLLGACNTDRILDVDRPDIVTPDNLQSESGLATLRAGALGDFALALSGSSAGHGSTPGLLHYTSSFTDEVTYSGTFPTRREFDERRIQERNGDNAGAYRNLHRARAAAENVVAAYERFTGSDATAAGEAEARSINGFTYVLFGESYCSGVPFSTAQENGELVFGDPLTTTAMFERAVEIFDGALAVAGPAAAQQSLARIGRGRALLNLGRFEEAAQAVAAVPTEFVYVVEHSNNSLREQNGFYQLSAVDRQYSVAEREGGTGLPFRSAEDPRAPWTRTEGEVGQDGSTPFYLQLKYPTPGSPVPLATGVEARLIEAEAALRANDTGGFAAIHDALRSGAGLPPLALAGLSGDQLVDVHFRERAFWLWLTAHRLGDMRRMVRQYGRAVDAVFPSGSYFKGGVYGPDVNFIIPVDERNNPNFTGCLDRNP